MNWRPLDGFPLYEITSEGWVRNKQTQRRRKTFLHARYGYHCLSLQNDVQKQNIRILALLMAHTYLGDPPNAAFNSIIHLDGNRANCRIDNIAWRPRWFAMVYHKQFNDGSFDKIPGPVINLETNTYYPTGKHCCIAEGILARDLHSEGGTDRGIFPLWERHELVSY